LEGEDQELYKVTVAGAYHRTDHYNKSLRPWSKLGKYSLNKSINLLISVLSLSKLDKCSLRVVICLFLYLMCGWEKRADF
jgi:hypothetical protein